VKAPAFTRTINGGGNKTVKFTGKFKKTGKLPKGKYKLTAVATDSGGLKSKSVSAKFKIKG
jgi:hypothetical protein